MQGGKKLKLVNVRVDNQDSIKKLEEFYYGIYRETFRNSDEAETLDGFMMYLSRAQIAVAYTYRIVLLLDEESNDIIGGAVFNYYYKTDSAVIEYIVIDKRYRGQGFGSNLYNVAISLMQKDAEKSGSGTLKYVFYELSKVSNLETSGDLGEAEFFNSLGFRKVGINYTQPSLLDGQKPSKQLDLVLKKYISKETVGAPKEVILDTMRLYFKYAFLINKPSKNNQYASIKIQMLQLKKVFTSNII